MAALYTFPSCDSEDEDLAGASQRLPLMGAVSSSGKNYTRAKLVETAFDEDNVYRQMTPEQKLEYRCEYDKQLSRKERTLLDAILSPPMV